MPTDSSVLHNEADFPRNETANEIFSLGPNYTLTRLIIAELLRCGVNTFFVSSGNWSTPIVQAIGECAQAKSYVHFDERGAAYAALGYGKRKLTPAVFVCSSGTAPANAYPAVLEAHQAGVPLILLTADRADELQRVGANQTTEQEHLFSPFVRWQKTITALVESEQIPSSWCSSVLSAVSYAVACAQGFGPGLATPGPVFFNLRFRKPFLKRSEGRIALPDDSGLGRWLEHKTPFVQYSMAQSLPSEAEYSQLTKIICRAKRGILAIGELPPAVDLQPIIELAQRLQWPVASSVLSGLRGERALPQISHGHWYLGDAETRKILAPDVVLQLGAVMPQLQNNLLDFLGSGQHEHIVVHATAQHLNANFSCTKRLQAEPVFFAAELLRRIETSPGSELLPLFQQAEAIAVREIAAHVAAAESCSELAVVCELFSCLENSLVYLGSSLPVRLAEWLVGSGTVNSATANCRVLSNRGLSGIDGNIASAIGCALAEGEHSVARQVVLLTGDLACLHDLNSLGLLRSTGAVVPKVVVHCVVFNNDGGGIFELMPREIIAPHYEKFFGTPHGLSLAKLAAGFGLSSHSFATMSHLRQCLPGILGSRQGQFVEVMTRRDETRREIVELGLRIVRAVRESLI